MAKEQVVETPAEVKPEEDKKAKWVNPVIAWGAIAVALAVAIIVAVVVFNASAAAAGIVL